MLHLTYYFMSFTYFILFFYVINCLRITKSFTKYNIFASFLGLVISAFFLYLGITT